MLVANQQGTDYEWHPDIGATHHLTNEMANLNLCSENYDGSDQIHVGNGVGLKIIKIGSSLISTPSRSFILNQVLFVPQITKNLFFLLRITWGTSFIKAKLRMVFTPS